MAKKPTGGTDPKPKTGTKTTTARRKPAVRAKKPAAEPANAEATVADGDASPAAKPRRSPAKPKAKPAQTRVRAPRRPKAVAAPAALSETLPPEPVEAAVVSAAIDPVAPVVDAPTPEVVEEIPPSAAVVPPHDEELPHGLSPVDLPVPETGEKPGLGWMTGILVLSSLLLVLFNSFAIDKWARSLPVNERSGQVIDAAAAWHGKMDQIDFNLPLETGRSAWHWVKALEWPGSDTADSGDSDGAARAD